MNIDPAARMTRPQRIQLRRIKGWRKPEGAIVVSRPSKWGNLFAVGEPSPWGTHAPMTRADAVEAYRFAISSAEVIFGETESWSANPAFTQAVRTELAGHDLACWCPLVDELGRRVPCHADVLLAIANGGTA